MDHTRVNFPSMGNNPAKVIRDDHEAKLSPIAKFQNLVELHLVKKFLTASHTFLYKMAAVD
jgi:hypothetical protein